MFWVVSGRTRGVAEVTGATSCCNPAEYQKAITWITRVPGRRETSAGVI